MTIGLGSPTSSPQSSSPQSKFDFGTILGKLPIAVIALMVVLALLTVLFPTGGERTVRSQASPLESVSATKLLFSPFGQGGRWLLTFAYFVDPWASNRAVVGDVVPAAAIADSPELAGLVGQQMSRKALYIAKQLAEAPRGYYAAVWYGDLKASDFSQPIDVGSRESIAMFLSNFGASAVIFPIAESRLPDQINVFDRVVTWGQQLHFIGERAPAETPPPVNVPRPPT